MATKEMKTYKIRGRIKFGNFLTPKSYDPSSNRMIEDQSKGAYSTVLVVENNEQNKEAIQQLQAECGMLFETYKQSEAYQAKKGKKELLEPFYPIKEELDKDGKPTGNWEIKFKRNAQNKDGKKADIRFYNPYKQPYMPDKEIGKDSDVIMNFCIYDTPIDGKERRNNVQVDVINYYATFCILKVQIIEHKTFDGDDDWMEEEIEPIPW